MRVVSFPSYSLFLCDSGLYHPLQYSGSGSGCRVSIRGPVTNRTWVLVCLFFRMLDDLERGVDRSDSKLQHAMKKMRKFVRDTEGQFSFFPSTPHPLFHSIFHSSPIRPVFLSLHAAFTLLPIHSRL